MSSVAHSVSGVNNTHPDAIDFLNWLCVESPSSREPDDAELEAHYRQRLADDARCEAAAAPAKAEPVVVPELRYFLRIGMKGKKFVASVECPDGRRVKAGTHLREDQAWRAAQTLAAELRGDAVAVA